MLFLKQQNNFIRKRNINHKFGKQKNQNNNVIEKKQKSFAFPPLFLTYHIYSEIIWGQTAADPHFNTVSFHPKYWTL